VRILFATSEATPFAKTGGLADVAGSLPVELARQGHDVSVILPAYRQAFECGQPIDTTDTRFEITIGSKVVTGGLLRSNLPHSTVPVYLVQQDDYFDREHLYTENGDDYKDNCERFVFFSRAVVDAIRLLDLHSDVVHTNDWQTGLVPALLATEYAGVPGYEQIASLFTIHNLAYQGVFWHWDMLLTGLDWKYFNWRQMEFHGNLNLMKTGLVFADALSTVSPRYAQEIQSAPLGCGLEGVLQSRREVLSGILNGVHYDEWNPATDTHLPTNYDATTFVEGKACCKAALQEELGLPVEANVPLVGFVGRLAEQKGIDLVADVMQQWVHDRPVQWAILGTGERKYHELFADLARRHPARVSARLQFSNPLAHRIEAGADLFLMPSRYEPCGLNQLYSLKYGTLPIVRATGGLADTITDATPDAVAQGTANGFSFGEYAAHALARTLERAIAAYGNTSDWPRLIRTGMHQNWSWQRSAEQYVALYQSIVARKRRKVYS